MKSYCIYIAILANLIGLSMNLAGIIGVKKVLKRNKETSKDEETLTEQESNKIQKYFKYIFLGDIFLILFWSLRIVSFILNKPI